MGDYGQVHQTFEEFAGRYIDDLYHGALFLNGGKESPAEDLVLWTLTGAFQEFRQIGDVSAGAEWIEAKLVEVFLARAASGLADDGSTAVHGSRVDIPSSREPFSDTVEIDSEALFRAGAKMPLLARAAIWLVVFRRWRYGDASIVLGTDVDGVKDLLRYRQVLLTAVVRRSLDLNGTDHDLGY